MRRPATNAARRAIARIAPLNAAALAAAIAIAAALAAGPAAPPAHAAHTAAIQGAGATGIQVQNLDFANPATAVIQFYGRTGAPIQITRIIPPGTAANVYLPLVPGLANGAYAMVVSADRQIAALARTDWETTRAAGIYSSVVPGKSVVLPLVVADYYGQTSLVSIQNTDTAAESTIHVDVMAYGRTTPAVSKDVRVAPGAAITLDFERDADLAALRGTGGANGFLGWMRVTGMADVAVQSFIDVAASQKAVYAFEGIPDHLLATELIAPLVRKRQATTVGLYDTGIAVVNPGAAAATVRVHYDGSTGACAGQSFDEAPVTVAAGSGATIYQGASGVLPSDCVASARITADAPIAAVVLDAKDLTVQGAAYSAVPTSQAARRVVLPLVRRRHTAMELTTGIQVTNASDAAAHVDLAFASDAGVAQTSCGTPCSVTIPARASRTFYPSAALNAMPVGTFGSAVVTSDRAVVVLVNDISENNTSDAATYIGLAAGDPAPAAADDDGAAKRTALAALGLGRACAGCGAEAAMAFRAFLTVGR